MLECLPLQQLHGDEAAAVVLADFVDRADVRMVQRGRSARLAQESLQRLFVAGDLFRQELQRDGPAERRVLGAVNHSHAPAAKARNDSIVGNIVPNERVGRHNCASSYGWLRRQSTDAATWMIGSEGQ